MKNISLTGVVFLIIAYAFVIYENIFYKQEKHISHDSYGLLEGLANNIHDMIGYKFYIPLLFIIIFAILAFVVKKLIIKRH